MNISSTKFDGSAPDLESCPDETLPEFAFIGRSNVGKSSLLNLLAGSDRLARVSPVPGFTKLLNFFTVNQTWRLVDLPGYGFAQVARKDSARFNRAVTHYLQERPNLCLVFALIESGLPPQGIDLEFVEWLTHKAVPFVLVFTKADKVPPAVARANIAAFMERIGKWFTQPPATFTCSAETGQGRAELLRVIAEHLAAIEAEAAQTASPAEDLPAPRPSVLAGRKPRPDRARPW